MFAQDDQIQELNSKYSRFEEEILVKLQELKKEQKLSNEKYPEEANQSPEQGDLSLDYQSAMKRNKQLKQDLDKSKARYRSRITYSPLEKILERAKQDYLRTFSVQPRP